MCVTCPDISVRRSHIRDVLQAQLQSVNCAGQIHGAVSPYLTVLVHHFHPMLRLHRS